MRKQLGYIPGTEPHYSKKVLIKTWFYYYKWLLLAGIVVAISLIPVVKNLLGIGVVEPDYSIAVVTPIGIRQQTAQELVAALEALGEDLNGDGVVRVNLDQMKLGAGDPETAMYYAYAAMVQLQADIQTDTSHFFLMSDPEDFQMRFQALADAEGNLPEDEDTSAEGRYVPFGDLKLTLSEEAAAELAPLYLGRRGYHPDQIAGYEAFEALWRLLTQ